MSETETAKPATTKKVVMQPVFFLILMAILMIVALRIL
jgi:hypothetical protein